MDNFAKALTAIQSLSDEEIVDEYAIGGAMASTFWTEAAATFDVDVFVLFQSNGLITSLDPIYRWARANGYPEKAEHIIIASVPVQVIPAYGLAAEAVQNAVEMDYEGQPVRVIRPEYLIAMSLEGSARTKKRLARVSTMLDTVDLNRALLHDLLTRYQLTLPEVR